MPEPDGTNSPETDANPGGHWRDADLKRALGAAEKAGLGSYRVEIAPDGTISIIVGAPEETAGKRD